MTNSFLKVFSNHKSIPAKVKFIMLVVGVGVIFLVGSIIMTHNEEEHFTQQRISEIAGQLQQDALDAEKEKKDELLSIALTLASNQTMHRGVILGERERPRMIQELNTLSESFREHTDINNLRVHIHDRDGYTVLRTFAPDFHGDDLTAFRSTARRIRDEQRPFTALEPGASAITIRAIAPMIRGPEYIGAVELSAGYGSISRDFKARGERYIALVNDSGLRASQGLANNRKIGPFRALSDTWFCDETFAFADQVDYEHLLKYGYDMTDDFFVTSTPLVGYDGNTLGYHVIGFPMERFDEAFESSNRIINAMLGILIFSIVAVVIATWVAMRFLISPHVREAVSQAKVIADGDFRQEMPVYSTDEFGQLAQEFNRMGEKLSSALHSVNTAIDDLSNNSIAMADTAKGLTDGSESQTSSISELSVAMTEMTSTIEQVAQNIQNSSEHAQSTLQASNDGAKDALDIIRKTEGILSKVKESAEAIESLGASVGKIGEFANVITDIADQTNLLALNAAIEAARAGESGRGFAVVADEVRKLAERTQDSTNQIHKLITELQRQAKYSVTTINQSVEYVEDGNKTAQRAGERLQNISHLSEEQAGMLGEIAVAAQQQSATANQISCTVENIQGITHENAQKAQDVAEYANDLRSISEKLKVQTSYFQLKNASNQNKQLRLK
ncbi:methyl-accepting chemotaxis protein [Desulfurispira natronophila]|uniref:Methyl-accepting chemotaxis protein n=1 Tax=Desulfurispira natronophila TaxID=682562 RepID=A0A7W7Y4C1_9BACT|nr:methyl-accepting chemotaxis protein [Desulfurispira natronophila]MBB5021799.1 methyl-accepting chemotaxis protein [Desulfurispira natronophila]